LECFHALREVVNDLILIVEAVVHLVLEAFAKAGKFCHRFALELLNVFVLPFELASAVVLKLTKLKRFVGALLIYFLVQFVFGVVNLLHDVFLAFNACLALAIELVLQV
jgi:hypothetical protein